MTVAFLRAARSFSYSTYGSPEIATRSLRQKPDFLSGLAGPLAENGSSKGSNNSLGERCVRRIDLLPPIRQSTCPLLDRPVAY